MARAVLERMLDASRLDALFERTAQQQYTRELLFSTTVELMAQVVLGRKPSVHAAYQALGDQIGVSSTAVYDKRQHRERAVSAALVHETVATWRLPSTVATSCVPPGPLPCPARGWWFSTSPP